MSRPVGGARLRLALVRFRRRHLGALLSLGLVAALFVVGVAVIHDSALAAIEESVRADQGQGRYVVQAGDSTAMGVLAAQEDFTPVVIERGQVVLGDLLSPAVIRTVETGLPFGVLREGRHATASGEATITTATSADLDAATGDTLSLLFTEGRQRSVRVVGITVFPADRDRRSVTTVDSSVSLELVTTWLTSADPYSVVALDPYFEVRTATSRSVDSLAEDAVANPPREIRVLAGVPSALTALMLVVIVTGVALLVPVAQRDINTLVAAGMSSGRAWRMYTGIGFGAVLAGVLVGAGVAIAGIYILRGSASGLYGQDWTGVQLPVDIVLLLVSIVAVLALVADRLVARAHQLARRVVGSIQKTGSTDRRRRIPVGGLVALSVGAAMTGYVLWARHGSEPSVLPWPVLPGIALIAASLPLIIRSLSTLGLGPGARAVVAEVSSRFKTIAFVAVAIAAITGTFAAATYHDANILERDAAPLQPPGSYVIEAVPNAALETLLTTYQEEGGSNAVTFDLVEQSSTILRVTSPRLLECMSEAGTLNPREVEQDPSCESQETRTPINTVALDTNGNRTLADQGLVEQGRVGLLAFERATGTVSSTSRISTEPSDILGGILPGLVVPAGGPVAEEYGLVPTGHSVVALLDYDTLDPPSRSRVRGAAAQLAPAALTADATLAGDYDRERARANTVAIIGATLVLLIMVLGGTAVALGHERTRRTLVEIGAPYPFRSKLAFRWLALVLVSFVVCIPITMLGTEILSLSGSESYGLTWILPSLIGILSAGALYAFFVKVPDRVYE